MPADGGFTGRNIFSFIRMIAATEAAEKAWR